MISPCWLEICIDCGNGEHVEENLAVDLETFQLTISHNHLVLDSRVNASSSRLTLAVKLVWASSWNLRS